MRQRRYNDNVSDAWIVGALNVTPDSFHDGGRFTSVSAAIKRAGEMLKEGADIIEIGGESTGPQSDDVSLEKELRRVIPVVQAIRKKYPSAALSVDTHKSAVAEAALREGVVMINDVTAGRADAQMFRTVAESSARIVLMYAKDPTPRTTIADRRYEDVVRTVKNFLARRKELAMNAGIPSDRIILDPGLGHFVSGDERYSFEIIRRLREFQSLGSQILISPSRKSFLASSEKLKPADRLPGTIAASAIAVLHGAHYIRTHDVQEVRRACEMAYAIGRKIFTAHPAEPQNSPVQDSTVSRPLLLTRGSGDFSP